MDDEVGIAADGRGEVRVVDLGQAVVADVLRRVDGQLHRPQDLDADELFAGEALGLLEDALEVPRADLGRLGQGQPEIQDEVPELFEVGDAGRRVDPVDRRDLLLREPPGHGDVGGDHEFLDEPMGLVALPGRDREELALLIDELRLDEVEVEAALGQAASPQGLGQLPHDQEVEDDVREPGRLGRVALKDLEHRRVGHAVGRPDDGGHELRLADPAVLGDLDQGGEGEPRHPGPQAAEVVRELLGEHRQGQVGEIDARSPLERLALEGASRSDVMRDIGDVDTKEPAPGRKPPDADGVVEVLGLLPVDRHGGPIAEVPPPLERFTRDVVREGRGLPHGRRAEFAPKPVAADDDLGVDARVLRPAKDAGDGQGRPVGLDDHPGRRMEAAAGLEREIVLRERIEGLEEGRPGPLFIDP